MDLRPCLADLTDQRIQIVGAWIEGRIELRHASIPESLWFYRCVFNAVPRLEGARLGGSAKGQPRHAQAIVARVDEHGTSLGNAFTTHEPLAAWSGVLPDGARLPNPPLLHRLI